MSNRHWSVPDIRNVDGDSLWNSRLKLELPVAKEFFQRCFSAERELQIHEIDQRLWRIYCDESATEDTAAKFGAELCLRCHISNLVSAHCLKLAHDFYAYRVTWYDLFTCFPYEDGRQLNWENPDDYSLFTIKVLQAYDPSRNGKVSLASLTRRMVRQDKRLLQYLHDHHVSLRSDWALLNRAALSQLSDFDAAIVKAFHDVYRRDRRKKRASKTDGKCTPPTSKQLLEMLNLLCSRGIEIASEGGLMGHLTRIASVLREQEILRQGGFPLSEGSGGDDLNDSRDLPDGSITNDPVEAFVEEAFQAFCERLREKGWEIQQELDASLHWGVEQGITDRLTFLRRKPKQAYKAEQFWKALYLKFCKGLSQKEIGDRLGIPQYEVSLLLNLPKLIPQIWDRTLEELLRRIVQVTQSSKVTQAPPEREYLDELTAALKSFLKSTLKEDTLTGYIQQFLKSRRSDTP